LPTGRDVVIDLGSGMEARNILPLRRFFRLCIATDFDVSARVLSRNLVAVRSNIVQLTSSLPEHSVDMFLLILVLEHVEQQDLLVSEIYRALKPGGASCGKCSNVESAPDSRKYGVPLELDKSILD